MAIQNPMDGAQNHRYATYDPDRMHYSGPPIGFDGYGVQHQQRPGCSDPEYNSSGTPGYAQGHTVQDGNQAQQYPHGSQRQASQAQSQRQSEQGQRQGHSHFDHDYHQWREMHIRDLDRDYEEFLRERYKKFTDEFDKRRSSRPPRAEQGTMPGSTAGGRGETPESAQAGSASEAM